MTHLDTHDWGMDNTADLIAHLQPGDYVKAEFQELSRPRWISDSGMVEMGGPTGRTYILEGELKEYVAFDAPEQKGLAMPNGQSVRQIEGSPGGNLVRIISHTHKGDTE